MTTLSYLPYHELPLPSLLISSTFLLALNAINSVLDRTLACGLVGQVLIGTAWGSPGAQWLSLDLQRVATSLGYLGLILIVYAGGVETDVVALRRNIALSVAVATTGVVVPIGLSFALFASPGPFLGLADNDGENNSVAAGGSSMAILPAFAAGAALCSTSLGTTFSVLRASGFSRTRLGAVLASAALLDDVVGLVMVRIITTLGKTGNDGVEPATIVRPVLVSVAFALIIPLVCLYILKPGKAAFDRMLQDWDSKQPGEGEQDIRKNIKLMAWIRSHEAGFVAQTAFLVLLIVAADNAGASILLAAYLAGAVVSWWGSQQAVASGEAPVESRSTEPRVSAERQNGADGQRPGLVDGNLSARVIDEGVKPPQHTASTVFDTYYAQAVHRVLKPFFFASIGFSIPISQLFAGDIIWRGVTYSILMMIGKLVCGLWLVRFPNSVSVMLRRMILSITLRYDKIVPRIRSWGLTSTAPIGRTSEPPRDESSSAQTNSAGQNTPSVSPPSGTAPGTPLRPLSLYPAALMGCTMVARGEIGFLISSMAESQGVFRRPGESTSEVSQLFLIVTWAIFLCTILGPLSTGLLVRRVKRLEKASEEAGGTRNVLGVWGVT